MKDLNKFAGQHLGVNQVSREFEARSQINLPLEDAAAANVARRLAIELKKKDKGEHEASETPSESVVMSDVTGMVVAQAEAAVTSIGATSGAVTGAAAVTESTAVVSGVATSAAASAASVVTTTSLATTTSALSMGTLASVAGGAAVAAGGGGGGASADPAPAPLPPANPYPGAGSDPATLDFSGGATPVHQLSVSQTTLPVGILNKSLVIDLGISYGPYQGVLYYTDKVGGVVTTHAVSYRDIQNVTGTALNDQITGNSGANTLDGGAGDDIIYGDGGVDVLRGGSGQDWVLFKALTRSGDPGQYNDGVVVNLAGTQLPGVVGTYRVATWANGAYAEASGFEHVVGSDGNDTLIGDGQDNILDGAGGDDVLQGGAGNDHLFGGTSTTAGIGNQMTGGTGADTFWVGYDIDPVYRAKYTVGTTETASPPNLFNLVADQTGITAVQNASVIHDWAGGGGVSGDTLRVSGSATAIMGGLDGVTGWAGNNTLDLRTHVYNSGLIKIAAGAGTNNLYLDSGTDAIWTGYQYVASGGVIDGHLDPTISGAATDIIWGWDGLSAAHDSLTVATGSTAVIGLLQGQADWSGSDTVDLRTYVSNSGTVVVSTDGGSNTVFGSAGVDQIYGSANGGTNQVWGGAGADVFYVGTRRDAATGNTSTVVSRDLLWDWEQGTDVINVAAGSTAVIAGRMTPSTWAGNDSISLASGVTNNGTVVVALGNGDDTFVGSSGVDCIYGGASTGTGNLITGGAGNDRFFVGYNYDPVADTRSELSATDTAIDVIRDWQDTDTLTVGTRGQAIIGGLYSSGTDWAGSNNLNVSAAANNGVIHVAMGGGTNGVTASTGKDYFHVGYAYSGTSSLTASASATDVIWGWDDQSLSRDTLAVAAGSTAVIGALLGQTNWSDRVNWQASTGWAGNDTVDLRQQVSNAGWIQIASGAGYNTVYGSSGSDRYFVGYVNNANGSTTASAAAVDMIQGWDAQAWSNLPLAGTWNTNTNWNGQADSSDTTYDSLEVAQGSTARIGSLSVDSATDAQRWDGVEIIDLRSNVTNHNMVAADGGGIEIWAGAGNDYVYGSAGRDLIYGGPGMDNLWGGDGNDVFYVGYSPSWAPFGSDAAEPRIWDWQNGTSASAPGDGLRIASGSFAIIQGLWGMNPIDPNRWSGNDTVDLRWDVINNGKIIVQTSTGDDTVYGSSGVDYINPGAGYNTVDLSNAGADRVYLDSFLTRTQINGFSSDDRIYLDTRVLQSFIDRLHITTHAGYSISASATDAATSISSGQTYDNGSFITSELTYDATFNASLQAYNANPKDPDFNVYGGYGDGTLKFGWTTNGAYNNEAYQGAQLNGKIAVIGAGAVSIAIGSSLAGIPFVGPFLAIPFWVNGGLMLNDGINNVRPYLNPVYNLANNNYLDSGASTLTAANTTTNAADSTWNNRSFLSFYNPAYSSGFVQSLEIGGQQPGYTAIASGLPIPGTNLTLPYTYYQAPALTGVASYLSIYNGTNGTDGETFIYLVASQDSLIQNNEAILVAQVNGRVDASQLVMYDGSTDADYLRYFNNTVEPPVFPANPSVSALDLVKVNSGKQVLFKASYAPAGFVTTDGSASVTESTVVTFSALTKGDQLSLGGLSFTAAQDMTSAQVAAAFQSLASNATTGGGTSYGSYSGTLSGWSSAALSGSSVTFTSVTANTNVSDLSTTANSLTKYIDSTAYGTLAASNAVSSLQLQGAYTNESSVSVTFHFDSALTATDTLQISVDGTVVSTVSTGLTGHTTYTTVLDISNALQGAHSVQAAVANTQGFTSQASISFVKDTVAPNTSDSTTNMVTVTETANALIVTSNEPGVAHLGGSNVNLTDANGNQATFSLSAQQVAASLALSVEDVFGLSSSLGNVWLGTNGDDSVPISTNAQYVYGFDGNDTITSTYADANNQGAALYGGAGNDTLNGLLNCNNKFVGGSGSDLLNLNGGHNTVLWNVTATGVSAASDSNSAAKDYVYGFNASNDALVVVANEVHSFDASTDVAVTLAARSISDPLNGGTSTFTQLGVSLDGTAGATGTGDLLVEIQNYSPSNFLFDLTGTSGNDVMRGGLGADTFTGGAGSDQFVFVAGDSTPTITSTTSGSVTTYSVSGFDRIMDIGLVGASAGKDILNLDGVAAIAADTTGADGTNAVGSSIKSHAISNGVVTFDTTSDTFSSAHAHSATLADAVAYLQANITGSNESVVFQANDTHTYLFQNNTGGDILIDLSTATVAGLTTDAAVTTTNYLYIV